MSDDADEREQAEAEALARALEGGAERAAPPADALEAAALLRYSGREGELAPDRADAVLERLLPQVGRTRRRRVRVIVWGAGGVLAAAAAAALVLWLPRAPADQRAVVQPAATAEEHAVAARLPVPPAALLAAQAGAAQAKDEQARARFETEMRAYRQALLGALERAYPARVGMLQPRGGR